MLRLHRALCLVHFKRVLYCCNDLITLVGKGMLVDQAIGHF